jgi:hypothetical protein
MIPFAFGNASILMKTISVLSLFKILFLACVKISCVNNKEENKKCKKNRLKNASGLFDNNNAFNSSLESIHSSSSSSSNFQSPARNSYHSPPQSQVKKSGQHAMIHSTSPPHNFSRTINHEEEIISNSTTFSFDPENLQFMSG